MYLVLLENIYTVLKLCKTSIFKTDFHANEFASQR